MQALTPTHGPMRMIRDATSDGRNERDVTIRVAVLQMQRAMVLPDAVTEELKQLKGRR